MEARATEGDPIVLAERLKARALELGFDDARIASVAPLEAAAHYEAWLAAGFHGGMNWLAKPKHRERRADPERICRELKSVLCVALCYPPHADPERVERVGRIARYASGDDYHLVMRDKLRVLERWIRSDLLPGSRALWYSDTGAILERGWAERAGIGWTGKHSGILSRERGSWFLLGEVLIDRALAPDAPEAREHCGTCERCLVACPTQAIVAPYRVDVRRCISYLTIEHRGAIPHEFRAAIGDWVFGCDLCQEACPWNRFAPPAREARLHARSLEGWTLERFLALDEAGFDALFEHSAIRRTRRDGFVRNVCVALGNRRDVAALPALIEVLERDASALVRAHAAWAIGEIVRDHAGDAAVHAVAALERAAREDSDDGVREEATRARQDGKSYSPSAGS